MNFMSTKEEIEKNVGENTLTSSGEIRTIQDMWNAAIEYFIAGKYDTDAMSDISERMNPKLTYQDIANVCSGVYADTYWHDTFMDTAYLSKSLVQALGINQSQANTYAKYAIAQWRGLLVRKNISDIGTIPTPGDVTQSIDIVCNQNTPIKTDDLIKNWNSQYWITPQVGKNYIYVRCANAQFYGSITNAKAQMFYSTGGFNQPPTSWIQCYTASGSSESGNILLLGGEVGEIPLGVRAVSEAFNFETKSTDHICVIAAITTDYFKKNKPTEIPLGNWNSSTYITHNGAAGWHNFDPQTIVESTLVFYNQDNSPEEFLFTANCRNVPVGSKIGLRSADPKFSFNSGLIEITKSSQQIEHKLTLPPNYKGQLIVTMQDKNGEMLPKNAAVQINMQWRLNKGHKHYTKAVKHFMDMDAAIDAKDLSLNMGSFTLTGGKK